MSKAKDHPGVYVPPPLIYVATFFLSLLLQKLIPFDRRFFEGSIAPVLGVLCIATGFFFNIPSLRQFFKTKNTIVTIRPANSLQTSGIYAISRNPMYISLLMFYTGVASLAGNWWTLLLIPLLVAILTYFVIRPEERYLERAFGEDYLAYKQRVRRWI